ncbi:hypothetical protein [Pseudoalteromonas sp. TAB23]|uniref:hypothetical protein n=1 Tax=Pseudoalteromonas sp. TAB23 TaxID=1938595 RepID=UPI000427B165|nr:hypothetical protein [Pseudoalteromonas sp. TAB23]
MMTNSLSIFILICALCPLLHIHATDSKLITVTVTQRLSETPDLALLQKELLKKAQRQAKTSVQSNAGDSKYATHSNAELKLQSFDFEVNSDKRTIKAIYEVKELQLSRKTKSGIVINEEQFTVEANQRAAKKFDEEAKNKLDALALRGSRDFPL